MNTFLTFIAFASAARMAQAFGRGSGGDVDCSFHVPDGSTHEAMCAMTRAWLARPECQFVQAVSNNIRQNFENNKCDEGSSVGATAFTPYFSYTGDLAVDGAVAMTTSGTTQTFDFSLSGVDPECASGAGSAGNSCGVHIHAGTTCTADALGHYFTGSVTSDPWTEVAYTSTASGTASGTFSVDTGGDASDVVGRAFVVHDFTGARIACSILGTGPQSQCNDDGCCDNAQIPSASCPMMGKEDSDNCPNDCPLTHVDGLTKPNKCMIDGYFNDGKCANGVDLCKDFDHNNCPDDDFCCCGLCD